jgi:hypothetical protein
MENLINPANCPVSLLFVVRSYTEEDSECKMTGSVWNHSVNLTNESKAMEHRGWQPCFVFESFRV